MNNFERPDLAFTIDETTYQLPLGINDSSGTRWLLSYEAPDTSQVSVQLGALKHSLLPVPGYENRLAIIAVATSVDTEGSERRLDLACVRSDLNWPPRPSDVFRYELLGKQVGEQAMRMLLSNDVSRAEQ